jgi:hypothetical protein
MEPVLACLVGQLGKRDEFLLCLHEKSSSHFAGTILNFHLGNRASLLVTVYMVISLFHTNAR